MFVYVAMHDVDAIDKNQGDSHRHKQPGLEAARQGQKKQPAMT
jgi:hypothetical protein